MARPSHNTRETILEAARQEFASHAFAGARVARIAARAGVNKQLLFYYFRSKAGLHRAVLETAAQGIEQTLEPHGSSPTERFRELLAHRAADIRARPELLLSLSMANPEGTALETMRQLTRQIEETVSTGQGLGYFRDDADPAFIARLAVAALLGRLGPARSIDPDHDNEDVQTWARTTADILLRSLTW